MNLSRYRYIFYTNIDSKVLYLRTLLNKYFLTESQLKNIYGLEVERLDYSNKTDVEDWCDIINNSYDDCHFTVESASKMFNNHLYFINNETFIFKTEGVKVGSVSIGVYSSNPSYVGLFRIAVKNDFKGKHYGHAIVLYALSYLQSRRYKYCEDIVSSKRIPSLMLHMSLGFVPLYLFKKACYTHNQKNENLIQKIRLRYHLVRIHIKHLLKLAKFNNDENFCNWCR